MCNAGYRCGGMRHLAGARNVRPALLMLGGLVAFMRACLRVAASAKAGGKKTFLLKSLSFK